MIGRRYGLANDLSRPLCGVKVTEAEVKRKPTSHVRTRIATRRSRRVKVQSHHNRPTRSIIDVIIGSSGPNPRRDVSLKHKALLISLPMFDITGAQLPQETQAETELTGQPESGARYRSD